MSRHTDASEAPYPSSPYYDISRRAAVVARRPDVFQHCSATQRRQFVMLGLAPEDEVDQATEMMRIMQRNNYGTPIEAEGFLLQHIPRVGFREDAIEVPWLDSPYQAQPGDFFDYPERMGFDMTMLRKGSFGDHAEAEGTAFLQSWLFFGLVCEMLGEVSYTDWVDLDRRVLVSPKLPHHLHDFSGRMQAFRDAQQLIYWTDLLELTLAIAEAFDDKAPSVIWSILTLGQMLSNIVLRVHNVEAAAIEQWPDGALLDQRLNARRWCPCLVNRLKTTLTMDSLYYLSMLNWDAPDQLYAPPSRRNHAECTHYVCEADQVDYDRYETAHTTANCKCEFIGLQNIQELYNILDEKTIPVIVVEGDKISIQRRSEDYVAISHVWADGLGNANCNSLPTCQLRRISQYLTQLTGDEAQPFWIDTICVPRDLDHRWKALDLMNQTYALAARVLVLDATLVKTDAHSVIDQALEDSDVELAETWRLGIALEMMTRIVCSPWTTRLWTLPEGQMSPLLYFRFLDTALELSDLYMQLELWPWAGSSLPYDLRRFLVRMRPRLRIQGARGIAPQDPEMRLWPTGSPSDSFISMLHAIEWRDTSRRIDEVLCMSIQLNLAVSRVMSFPDEEKLAELLRQVGTLPVDLIFTRGPRIEVEGFRWAPRNLLDVRKNYSMIPASKADTKKAQQTERGLLFDIECMQLTLGDLPSSPFLMFSATRNETLSYHCLAIDCENPKHMRMWQDPGNGASSLQAGEDTSAVYLLQGREGFHGLLVDQKPARIGLLVAPSIEQPTNDIIHARPLLTVAIFELPPRAERPRLMPGGGGVDLWSAVDLGVRKFCIS